LLHEIEEAYGTRIAIMIWVRFAEQPEIVVTPVERSP
jgi:hypothetical protein